MTTTPQQPEGTEPDPQNGSTTPGEGTSRAPEADSAAPAPSGGTPDSIDAAQQGTNSDAVRRDEASPSGSASAAADASPVSVTGANAADANAAADAVGTPAETPSGSSDHQPTVPVASGASEQPTAPVPPAAHPAVGAPYNTHAAPAHAGAYGEPAPSPYASDAAADTTTTTTTKRSGKGRLLLAGLAIGALVGGGAGAGVSALIGGATASGGSGSSVQTQNLTVNDTDNVTRATAIAAVASPSVVTLSVQGGSTSSGSSSGGSGSGIVLSEDGYILTNNHVVTLDGQLSDPTIRVTAADGKIYNASIVGTDPVYDLAVVKLEDASGLTPMTFADSDKLNVGDTAVAIGAPLGLAGTVTDGIVSAINRSITVASSAVPDSSSDQDSDSGDGSEGESPFDGWGFNLPGQEQQTQSASQTISLAVVQTDAAINPGNSGGALVNSDGELIGVNVAIASAGSSSSESESSSGSIGVGFAIQANVAKRVADEIIADGAATHGLLGATVSDAANSSTSTTVGAELQEVTSGGAAEKGGLRGGDVITAFNGHPISNGTDLTAQVRALAAGAEASVTYVRNGSEGTADVTLGELDL
ncbi:PDZ domain-containing protein [Mycetocola reblochoni]|uniref:Peptidase S1 and S6, chymotrypsin/Hap n=2 Tax=Mycetocola reblochoni TaxID=331618 RepID=A0A1R4JA39_9MICO|nr:trypsin-like peptidase domain-containing protein [Mycetocola reblochoni]RLP70095.1 PDZ domain-containing protein [Mycetocola reblochoni]SJN28573.1 peptidase S1 and S6, chymotrypsin/Hap [Mycetocola reblochoni REB411]